MGKATRWLKSILGIKNKEKALKDNNTSENGRGEKVGMQGIEKRWSFTKQTKDTEKENRWFSDDVGDTEKDQSKHAIAVAAATAAAADAAVAAAQAAVAVVKLTSQGRGALFPFGRERRAAVKIQTCFRGFLARKALRALRSLVKLQAHVRGYLVRKRAAATLQSMQTLIRAQAAARSQRTNRALDKNYKLHSEFRPRRSIEKFDEKRGEFHSKRLSTSYEPHNAYEGSPKIVEIDTYKPRSRSKRINPTVYDFSGDDFQYPTMSSPLPCPVPGRLSMPGCRNTHHNVYEWSFYGDEYRVSTAYATPRFPNSIRSNGPTTPTRSVCGDSFFRPYSNFPSYMADTESFRAKLRSQSAPKQRPDAPLKKKLTLDEIMACRNSLSGVRMQRSSSQVHDNLNF
ncbi:hypothetical protein Cgig2_010271 [Carnegiea gigantea]|uniref:DUF4005 domain-containing protein n=1 Tax=Carnegiea gigantea TaxID=171969 RepID=A0A9Q1JJW2_9CARY|nr:hypothetical protein Cgig2_010271 [Carnegiea gigantea]